MSESRRKLLIIGTLFGIVVLMAIGYAAFASVLEINGTATITSKWDIHLESIRTSSITGTASDVPYDETLNPDGTRINGTTAIFKTNLVSPSDSVTYSIVITNGGTLDASLDNINTVAGDNSAIIYSISGIDEGDVIKAGESKNLLVTVTYNSNVTSQPEKLSSTLTVTLNFVQAR